MSDDDAEMDAIVAMLEDADLVKQYVNEDDKLALRLTKKGAQVGRAMAMAGDDDRSALSLGGARGAGPHPLTPTANEPVEPAGNATLPGLRTLRSPTFRSVLGVFLIAVGTVLWAMLIGAIAADPDEIWGHDFHAFYLAAERLLASESPYTAAQLDGPIDAICGLCYLYPPPFAQALAPLTALTLEGAKVVWLVLQAAFMLAAVWIATGIGGARRGPERLIWSVVASLYFTPVLATVWFGNVSTLLALLVILVALGGAAAGLGAAAAAMLKVVPATLWPAALAMDRSSRVGLVAGLLGIAAISFILAPDAWLDYPAVLRNLLAGSTDYVDNHAPAHLVAGLDIPVLATATRVSTIALAFAAVVASVPVAHRPGGAPGAALLGTVALLLLPATLWFHYLAVLLPFAAMAWPGADRRWRAGLFVAAVVLVMGSGEPWIAMVGATALVLTSGWLLLAPLREAGSPPRASRSRSRWR